MYFLIKERGFKVTLGEKIKFLRERRGYSLSKLEKLSGVSDSYISDIETGKTGDDIKLDKIKKLAKALGADVDFLVKEHFVSFDELAQAHDMKLPDGVQSLIISEEEYPYLKLAKSLKEQKIPIEHIEAAINFIKTTLPSKKTQ
jgi:transcriptional regulator with XRE-family HTH domain